MQGRQHPVAFHLSFNYYFWCRLQDIDRLMVETWWILPHHVIFYVFSCVSLYPLRETLTLRVLFKPCCGEILNQTLYFFFIARNKIFLKDKSWDLVLSIIIIYHSTGLHLIVTDISVWSLNQWKLPLPLPMPLPMPLPIPLPMPLPLQEPVSVLPIKHGCLKEKWQWWAEKPRGSLAAVNNYYHRAGGCFNFFLRLLLGDLLQNRLTRGSGSISI